MSARTVVAPGLRQITQVPSAERCDQSSSRAGGPTGVRAQVLAASPRMAAQRRALSALQVMQAPVAPQQPAAVVQRKLSDEDTETFDKWLSHQAFKLGDQQRLGIIHWSDTLDEAQQQAALDAEAAEGIAKRREGYKKLGDAAHAKAKKPGPAQAGFAKAAELIDQTIAELDDAQAHGGLGKGMASAVDSLAQLLLETHPPDTCTYVLMGNSPAPLLAWLTLNGYGPGACHLPLGGLTTPKGEDLTSQIGDGPLPPVIASYLDLSLATVLQRGLPIVLIDYVSSGGSLAKTASYIERWLAGKGREIPVSFFGYSERTLEEASALNESPHGGVLATSEGIAERVLTRLNADKVLKNFLLIRGPASLDLEDLLAGKGPTMQPQHWKRVLRLMQAALSRTD